MRSRSSTTTLPRSQQLPRLGPCPGPCPGRCPGRCPGARRGHGPGARMPAMLKTLRRGALIVALGLLLRPDAALAQAQPAVAAPPSGTRTHVDTLASPKLEGRLIGSPGADAAAA